MFTWLQHEQINVIEYLIQLQVWDKTVQPPTHYYVLPFSEDLNKLKTSDGISLFLMQLLVVCLETRSKSEHLSISNM